MTTGWAYSGAPPLLPAPTGTGTVTLLEGVTFCICDRTGDIIPGGQQGLFFRDNRFVTRLELDIDGQRLEPLTVNYPAPYAAEFVTRRPPRAGAADSTLMLVRRRYVGNGMLEELIIHNLGHEATSIVAGLTVDTDFAGLFEVKEGRVQPRGTINRTADGSELHMSYLFAGESRAVTITSTASPVITDGRITWHAVIGARGRWTAQLEVDIAINDVSVPRDYRLGEPVTTSAPAAQLAAWRHAVPTVTTPDEPLLTLLHTSAEDLGSLRIFDPDQPEHTVVAAGAPWFMTLFGRDSLLTSWMVLPLDASLALGTLQTLARLQGTKVDPASEEEPGRILHEIRSELDTELALGGSNIYYGSVDATPLFVMLLDELNQWGADAEHVEALLPHADRALAWIDNYGDRDGDGFVEYQRATDRGLVNQGWKDSFDAINFASGTLAEGPIALAEVQGYVYAAYLARARLALHTGDLVGAQQWTAQAETLKQRFNRTFWLADRGYYAVALDADKRPVDALTSNIGHCLWTGIVDDDKTASIARHLLSPEMFTGFGVRTLASSMGAYNPMSYHNGSVWPHDNAIIAAGLMRYGRISEAQQIATAIVDAGRRFAGRLPELFCGFDRAQFPAPVPYPTSCSPQAWAAASPLLLLRTLLRFDPSVPNGRLWCYPAVPEQYLPLRIERLSLASTHLTVNVDSQGFALDGLPPSFQLLQQPRPIRP